MGVILISISLHTNSVNWNFRGTSTAKNRGHRSMKSSAVRHIQRDENDAKDVKFNTKSAIDPSITSHNVIYTKDGFERLKNAQKLIDERLKARENSSIEWTPADQKLLETAKRKVRSTRRAYSRSIKNGNTPDWQAKKKQAWIDAKNASAELSKRRADAKKGVNKKYQTWASNVGVGGFSTVQLSKSSLEKMGWQFHIHKRISQSTGREITVKEAYSYDEQRQYDDDHPNKTAAISNVKGAYSYVYDALSHDPDHFGAMVSASLHFDESIPHLDFLTLDLGVDLDGNQLGHVGLDDNGTGGDLLNVRHRTFVNGSNYVGTGSNDRNRDYTSFLQDRLSENVKNEIVKSNEDQFIDLFDLRRGTPKNEHSKQRKEQLGILKIEDGDLDSMLSEATTKLKEIKKSSAEISATNSKASAASSAADVARSVELTNLQSSLVASNQATLKASIAELSASSQAMSLKASKARSRAQVELFSSFDDMTSSFNASFSNLLKAHSAMFNNSMSSLASIGFKFSVASVNVAQISAQNGSLANSINSKAQSVDSVAKNQASFKSAVKLTLHQIDDPFNYKNEQHNKEIDRMAETGFDSKGNNVFMVILKKLEEFIKKNLKKQVQAVYGIFKDAEQDEQNNRRNRNERNHDLSSGSTEKNSGPDL